MPQKTQDAVQLGAPVAYAVQPGAQVAQPGAPSIMIASSGSDAAAEASQQRPRRVSPGVAAAPVCAASQLAAGACLLATSAYHCSPSNSGESGACSFAEFLFGALLLMFGGGATVVLFIAGFGVLVIGSDAAAEASQQRLRRVSRRLAAVCVVSLLVLVVTYLNTKGPIDSGKYDCSPSDPDESGGCPKNFTVGESCELIAPAGPGDSGTCDADGRCICQSIGATLGGIVGLLFGAAAAVELFIVGCVVLVIPAVCCPDRRCCCCCGGKGRSAEDENTNLLPEVAGPRVGSSRCSTDQSSIYTPSTDRTSYGSTATTHR